MADSIFKRQAGLLIRLLPLIGKLDHFALKGGTAINFFIRALPRLSVDIDLTFIPIMDREATLKTISDSMNELSNDIERRIPNARITKKHHADSQACYAVVINLENTVVKIEPNLIIRGAVFPTQRMDLHRDVQEKFHQNVEMQLLSFAEIYGGKICAALDRQHPRDLFDINILLGHEGLEDKTRMAFIIYLISHSRPIAELLAPNLIDIKNLFENEFQGMANIPVTLDSLISQQKNLAPFILKSLRDKEKRFILSIKEGKPEWNLLGVDGINKLPAVQWKLHNIAKMTKRKHKNAYDKLERILQL